MTSGVSNGAQTFGALLRSLRVTAGLTQEELAERAGLTPHGVSSLERGRRTRPYPHTVRALAGALELDEKATAALFATLPRRTSTPAADAVATGTPAAAGHQRGLRLRMPSTPLHGREEELSTLVGLVRSGERLISVVGPGGVGKTRLAGEVAERLAPDFVDGSAQVDLAHTTVVGELLGTIHDVVASSASGVPAGATTLEAVELLAGQLADRRLLLVLDNLEQVPDAGEPVASLTRACPGLVVLVTSRTSLRVRDETVVLLEPLPVPAGAPTRLADIAATPSGALFLERARSAAHHLPLRDADAPAVAEICRRLAGLPLALELAASQLAVVGPDELVTRLGDALRQPGAADLPDRQRTLHATLEWSRGLLTDAEQRLLCRLAVFRGGFTLDAAESVGAPAAGTWSALRRLVEQSLVQATRTSQGATRYRMLEPIAEYAAGLLDADSLADARDAHAAYLVRLAEDGAAQYAGEGQVAHLARLDAEEANLTAAMRWLLADGRDPVSAGRLGWALWLYWWLRGRADSARELLEQVLRHELPDVVAANAWLSHASMTFALGELATSAQSWEKGRVLAVSGGDEPAAGTAVAGRGIVALAAGDLASARSSLEQALTMFRGRSDWRSTWMTSLCKIWLGTVLYGLDDRGAAEDHLRAGMADARARGDRLTTYIALFNLAQVAATDGDTAAAQDALEEAARLSLETRDAANLAYVAEALAVIAAQVGAPERVPLLVGAAEELRAAGESAVYGYYIPDAEALASALRAARSELGDDRYDDILDKGRGLTFEEAAAVALGH